MFKKFLKFSLLVLIVGGIWLYYNYRTSLNYRLDPQSTERVSVTVPTGASSSVIAELLNEAGLIKSEFAFKRYLKKEGLDAELKAGNYVFQANQSLPEIVTILSSGQSGEVVVTLLEGWTAKQMAEHLEGLGLTTASAFMSCLESCDFETEWLDMEDLEGYLYPDTYFVDGGSYSDEAFITRLLSTFESKLSEEDLAAIESSGRTLEEIIIMASIVEREERLASEKPTVAGILWNRFENGMHLGADATVLYALGRTSGGLTGEDLQADSPYNTRKYVGLPPGPISNPSIESIRAAIYPNKTDYFYYLHDPEGGIHYAETLEGHNLNKANHL